MHFFPVEIVVARLPVPSHGAVTQSAMYTKIEFELAIVDALSAYFNSIHFHQMKNEPWSTEFTSFFN